MAINKPILAIACGSFMVVVCIFYITSNALPSWASAKLDSTDMTLINNYLTKLGFAENSRIPSSSIKVTVGLWRSCGSFFGETMCDDLPSTCSATIGAATDVCNKMMAARAFMIIACIISGISAICLFACAVETMNQNQMVIIITKVLTIGSFVMGVIGLALGVAFTTYAGLLPIKVSVSVAAILAIVGVVINMLATAMAMIIR